MPLALLALAISAFGIGATEFVIMGLLPEVAGDFAVSIPTAGLLISGYALGVVIGGPLLTVLGTRIPRKGMLLMLMVLFLVGNLVSAVAPAFGLLLAGRVIAAFAHGAFFGIGSVVAADLVAPHRKAGAIALMFTGLTAANVLGVPMGTLLGQHFGWRSTFWVVAALGLVGLAGIAALVPVQPRPEGGRLGPELAVFRRPQIWLALSMTVLGWGGIFAMFTYITPMMTDLAGFDASSVTWLLFLFGVGLFAGNLFGGWFADRALMRSLYVTLSVPAALLFAWLGGVVITAGLGYAAPNWVGGLLTASALGVAVLSGVLERRAGQAGRVAGRAGQAGQVGRAGQAGRVVARGDAGSVEGAEGSAPAAEGPLPVR